MLSYKKPLSIYASLRSGYSSTISVIFRILLKDVKSYLNENNINSDDIIIAGNTLSDYENDIKSIFLVEDLKLITCYPTPSDTIDAFERFENPEKYIFDAFTLDAIYARKSQAERLKKSE